MMTSVSSLLANTYSYASANAGHKQSASAKSESVPTPAESATPETVTPAKAAPGSLASAAAAAREKIDAGYAKLGTTGTTRTTADEWDEIGFPDFDRQMLYAVTSNEGGIFTDVEVNAAKNEIANRISDIINTTDPLHQNPVAVNRAIIEFYDAASDDEKASFDWAVTRASAQKSYELSGGTENVSTGNPIVDKLIEAWDQVIARNGNSNDFANMPAYRDALMAWSQANDGARHVDVSA
ncbi:hypothetical protein [Thalassospira alkalitolerans]|uniref:hypothetical protein n=1 Tax=Thalassospira alkalitolerans TaxID=1293890 RepID=UPI003AA9B8F2